MVEAKRDAPEIHLWRILVARGVSTVSEIQQVYSDWLQTKHWDYFFTTTFRSPRKEPYYALNHCWHELKNHHVARAFIGVEPHKSGDLHLHGLLAGRGGGWQPEIKLPWDIWEGLFERFGRSKVEACNSQEAVTAYCAKYVLKAQSSASDHYGVYGTKFAWRGT